MPDKEMPFPFHSMVVCSRFYMERVGDILGIHVLAADVSHGAPLKGLKSDVIIAVLLCEKLGCQHIQQ